MLKINEEINDNDQVLILTTFISRTADGYYYYPEGEVGYPVSIQHQGSIGVTKLK